MNLLGLHDLELDGELTGANGASTPVHCRIKMPLVRHAPTVVELSVLHAAMPIPDISNPCHFAGKLQMATREINVTIADIYYRQLTTNRQVRSKTGLQPIKLAYVGRIAIRDAAQLSYNEHSVPVNVVRFHLTAPDFLKELYEWKISGPRGGEFTLFTTQVPGLGEVSFVRYWASEIHPSQDSFTGRAGLYATVAISDFEQCRIENYVAILKDALLVISMLCRQQIQLVGWELQSEQVLTDPLEPLQPPYIPPEPGDYLVNATEFRDIAGRALAAFFAIDDKFQLPLKLLMVGATPFVKMAPAQRYMAMMHGFEVLPDPVCEKPAELTPCDIDLIATLERAHASCADQAVCDRIEGLIKKIRAPQKNFAGKMRRLPSGYRIPVSDLWPICGSKKKVGLIEIRDRLAHRGPTALDTNALAVAGWHLGVLVERTVLVLLGIDLSRTRLTRLSLQFEYWYDPAIWESERESMLR